MSDSETLYERVGELAKDKRGTDDLALLRLALERIAAEPTSRYALTATRDVCTVLERTGPAARELSAALVGLMKVHREPLRDLFYETIGPFQLAKTLLAMDAREVSVVDTCLEACSNKLTYDFLRADVAAYAAFVGDVPSLERGLAHEDSRSGRRCFTRSSCGPARC